MPSIQKIACRFEPIPAEAALIARRNAGTIYSFSAPVLETWPVGYNFGDFIIDMGVDGRVLNIDFLGRFGGSLVQPRQARKLAGGAFQRLYLSGPGGSLKDTSVGLRLCHKKSDFVQWTFGEPKAPTRLWLGSGSFAEIDDYTLAGIGIVFAP